jgi:RNA-directed DNA polymerase
MTSKIAEFNTGKRRREPTEYTRLCSRRRRAKKQARQTGDWSTYKTLTEQMLNTPASDPLDQNFKRMYFCRYADDWLIGIIGSKADAQAVKVWLSEYLKAELKLELSPEKTVITNVSDRVRFLGYDIKRWSGERRKKVRTKHGVVIKRTCTQHLALLLPNDKCAAFVKKYGRIQGWHGQSRSRLLHLSELEIMMTYNAEIRGFMNFYAMADNLTSVGANILWLTTSSFVRTVADKRRS